MKKDKTITFRFTWTPAPTPTGYPVPVTDAIDAMGGTLESADTITLPRKEGNRYSLAPVVFPYGTLHLTEMVARTWRNPKPEPIAC